MTGRVIIVTGANSGIGFEATKYLCDGGNEVILACRNEEKGKAAVGKILKANPNALASYMQLDLADLASVRQFVEDFHQSGRKLHVLVNNAGMFLWYKDPKHYYTKENFELTMGTNHLGHFLLTSLLLDDLKKTGSETGDSRIVIVSSMLHDGNARNKNLPALDLEDIFLNQPGKYSSSVAYKNSKLANILFCYELAKKLEGTGVTVNCLCPGFIPSTELARHASAPIRFFTRYVLDGVLRFTKVTRSTSQGAKAVVDLATDEKLKGVSGKYYKDGAEVESSPESKSEELAQKMWELSARYCHMEGYDPLDAPPPPVEEPKPAETPAKDKKKAKKEEAVAKVEGEGETEVRTEGEGQAEVKVEGEGQAEVKVEAAAAAVAAVVVEVKEEKEAGTSEKKEEKSEEKKEEKSEEKKEDKKEEKIEEKKAEKSEENKEEGPSETEKKEEEKVIELEPEMKGKEIDPIEVEKKAVETLASGDTAVSAQ